MFQEENDWEEELENWNEENSDWGEEIGNEENSDWEENILNTLYENCLEKILNIKQIKSVIYDDKKILVNIDIKNIFDNIQKEIFNIKKWNLLQIEIKNLYENEINFNFYMSNDENINQITKNKFVLSNILQQIYQNLKKDNMLITNMFLELKQFNTNDNCIICNQKLKHKFYKPYICEKDTCYFSYLNFSKFFNLNNTFQTKKKVVDLLISLFYKACSNKHEVEYMYPELTKFECMNILNKLPSINEINSKNFQTDKELKNYLTNIHYLLYDLLVHIINSCSIHLEYNDKKNNFTIYSSVNKMNEFNKISSGNIIKKVYHGSNINNWHNILRIGLKNYSGTEKQANGSLYGSGIYLSKNKEISREYAKNSLSYWKGSKIINKYTTIWAECLLSNKGYDDWTSGPHYVVSDDRYVNIISLNIN
jgi:hypothetical protein